MLNQKPQVIKADKPWGTFERYAHNAACTVKIISVVLGSALSRHYHHHRDELYPSVFLDPSARVELGVRILHPKPGEKLSGEKLFIPKGV